MRAKSNLTSYINLVISPSSSPLKFLPFSQREVVFFLLGHGHRRGHRHQIKQSPMSRICSQCRNNGHNSRTCPDSVEESGIMLFGVRLTDGAASFRKSASMNNLSQLDQAQTQDSNVEVGYASDDVIHASGRSRERKRGVPWSEEEHKLFLLGLQKVGKGDWRGISRNFVKTRTPTQVASHAQKYFLRRSNLSRRRRRSSLFDITTDSFMDSAVDEGKAFQDTLLPLPPPNRHLSRIHLSPPFTAALSPSFLPPNPQKHTENPSHLRKPSRPFPILPVPPSSKLSALNLNKTTAVSDPFHLSLKLSSSTPHPPESDEQKNETSSSAHPSSNFESMISVA